MVKLVHGKPLDERFIGPHLDDGAPYSKMGSAELTVLHPVLLSNWNGQVQSLPENCSLAHSGSMNVESTALSLEEN